MFCLYGVVKKLSPTAQDYHGAIFAKYNRTENQLHQEQGSGKIPFQGAEN